MAISHLYPDQRPALNLNFARSKTLDPRITFTRNSTATYVGSDGLIKTAAAGEARFDHDPVTGESLGLLVEESRTNLRTYSSITTAEYTSYQNRATITSSTEVAPDGTISGVQISNNTGADDQYCWGYFTDYVTVPTTGYICASIFVKMIAGTEIRVRGEVGNQGWIGFAGVTVDFSTETPTVTLTGASGQNAIGGGAIPYPNGWWRIWYYINTADGFNNGQTRAVGVVPSIDGTSACIWGAQIEAGSFPTSYIPTTSSTVTRSADLADMTGTNFSSWYNQSEGTISAKCSINADPAGNAYVFSLHGPIASQNRIAAYINSSTRAGWVVTTNSAAQAGSNYGDHLAPNGGKFIIGYKLNDFAFDTSLGPIKTNPSGTPSSSINVLAIAALQSGSSLLNGHIARLTYYNTRLSDTELQALTL